MLVGWVKEGDAVGFAHPGQTINLTWQGVLSIPRAIASAGPSGSRTLLTYPVEAVESLRGPAQPIAGGFGRTAAVPAMAFDLDATLPLGGHGEGSFTISILSGPAAAAADEGDGGGAEPLLQIDLQVDNGTGQLCVSGAAAAGCAATSAPFELPASATELAVRVLADRSIVEIFLGRGLVAYTARVYP